MLYANKILETGCPSSSSRRFRGTSTSSEGGFGKSYLEKLAKEEGYTEVSQIHWFKLAERTIPVGLEVIYDGHPRGTAP